MLKKFQKYFGNHKVEIVLLLSIIIIASFLRLYRISDYMTFLGDEGRDAIVAKDILHGNFTLLGPRASAGDFFLGPIYYYMMAPFLLLSGYDPVGPAVMVALFGVATVYLVYHVGSRFFNTKAGLMAAALYALSPLVIAYSRSSWNPNPMPFFSLLLLYLLYVAVKDGSKKLLIPVGLLLGIAIQLHYLTTFLLVIVFFFVAGSEFLIKKKDFIVHVAINYALLAVGFLIGFLPFLAFEFRHGFPNIRTILAFIFAGNTSEGSIFYQSFFGNIWDVFFRLFARLITTFPPPEQVNVSESLPLQLLQCATILLAVISILFVFKAKDKLKVLLLVLWLFFGVVLFGFYSKSIYDYYLGFMFPLPFLLVGNMLSQLSAYRNYRRIGMIVAVIVFIFLLALNLWGIPFRYPPNKQKAQAKRIADFVLSQTDGKPFNFALITSGNSDHVYRYFFETANHAPVTILNPSADPERKSVTQQLLIVCEVTTCQPLGNPLWEVAGFGQARITGSWDVPFVKIYRLIQFK